MSISSEETKTVEYVIGANDRQRIEPPAPEPESGEGVEIAHVLFCDIIGYSLLPIDQQKRAMRILQKVVKQTTDYKKADARKQLVRLPAGDGIALAFLRDAVAPARCAFEIAAKLKTYPEVRLRIGAHSGPVFRSADINANQNVVGSGINLAQRVMDCGDEGHILVSRNVAEVLGQVSHWHEHLHDLGVREVKHGVRIHLYNLYTNKIGNPEMPTKFRRGTSIRFDRYEILSQLGSGGMGEVFLARDSRLNRRVALKVLPDAIARDVKRLQRFEHEAKAASALNHPNILTIFEFANEEHSHYIVLEYIEGITLTEKIASGQLNLIEILSIVSQVTSALASAHEAGIIHRDIKPDNIMVRRDGLVKVLDFGLAKLSELHKGFQPDDLESPNRIRINTNPGTVMGTPTYMSPEQARGLEVDSRTDIFSLGVVLYEMLTGKRPFEGESDIDVMSAIISDEPSELQMMDSKISPALQKIVRNCLAKKPERRFHSAHDLNFALEMVTGNASKENQTLINLPASITKNVKTIQREKFAWITALVCTILALASLFGMWQMRNKQSPLRTFRQINFRREAIFQASFAPDGKTVVYSGAIDGNTPQIFSLHPGTPVPQPVGNQSMHLLDVSSDGELAVLVNPQYMCFRTFIGTLARMPMLGGSPREIVQDVKFASWSPDGTQLAIIRQVDGKDRLEYPVGKVIYEVSGEMSDVRISPDGKRLAFFEHPVKRDDSGSLAVVDLTGKKNILSDGHWSQRGLVWSPDGTEIFFSASVNGGSFTIFAVTPDGTRRIADQSPGGLILQAVSPDGKWLANRLDYRYGAMAHSAGTEEDIDLTWLKTSKPKALSQDGKTLLFLEDSLVNNNAICIRKIDGSPVVRLGEGIPMDLSPDGKSVLASLSRKPQELVIYPTGAGVTRHLERGKIESYSTARWFRDGKRILISGKESGQRVRFFVQDISGGAPQAVTPEGISDGRISPDGKQILGRSVGGKYMFYSLDGGEPQPVPGLTETDVVIQWSADGASCFTYHALDIPCRVERVNLTTGKREFFREMGPSNRNGLLVMAPIAISDDERSYAYSTYQQMSSLFVVE